MQFKTKQTPLLVALMLFGLLAWPFAGSALAQDNGPTETPTRTITVSGQGEVQARPDTAFVSLSVVTEAEEAAVALDENSQQIQSVLDTLSESGIADEDIETQSVRLDPVFAQPGPQEPGTTTQPTQEITGYRAINMIQVRVTDLANLGTTIDTAVSAGANQVQGIRFEVSNPGERMNAARMAAWQDAQNKAQQLAELSGASLGQVMEIRATDQGSFPFAQAEFSEAAAAVPIRPGAQTLSASLHVTWQLTTAGEGRGEDDGETSMPPSEMVPDDIVQQVTAQLTNQLGLDPAAVAVVSAESVEWPDASLGCPQPGQVYAQMVTPGYRIVVDVEGEQYEFHTSTPPDTQIVRCESGETE